jgi:hypothetical protein
MRTKINQQGLKGALTALFAISTLAAASPALAGSACPPLFTENFDSVTRPALPAGWVASRSECNWCSNLDHLKYHSFTWLTMPFRSLRVMFWTTGDTPRLTLVF